ncbi:hypothetical protein BGX27_000578 [Mortierella sp. AM989]|nr:hypothetical protein BGX27_000578 [Mortierella sp. AM989]
MAKLGSKREHVRGWTASTFLPDGESSTSLDAISENAMDEDLLQDDETAQDVFGIKTASLNVPFAREDLDGSDSDAVDSDSVSDSDDDDDDDDGNYDDNSDEDNDHNLAEDDEDDSSQDQGTSEDSDEDIENTADGSSKSSERIGVPKRSRTGIASRKKRTGSLSTSPSNPSKLISATPTKKITKKSKKCVKAKSSKGSLSSAAARQATEEAKLEAAKPIVSRFLELENTKLNDKLLQVFMISGMVPYVIESITRLDPVIAKSFHDGMDVDVNQESKFMTRVEQCRRKRDYSDLNLMKRSYTAMNFITRSDVYNEFILSSSHQSIVKELFKIFRPESNGNFYHFQKVFETILKKFRAQTMSTLFEDVDSESGLAKTPMIFDMLPFLDQTPVSLSMIKVLFPTYTYGFADKIQEYYRILQNGHFMEMLLAMVTLTNEPLPNMADFIVSLLDEATKAKDAKAIFSCFADDPIWVERLTQGVQSSSSIKRHGCIEIIYSILVRRVTLPGYTVYPSFTVARLWLLDSIYHCLNDVKDNPLLLGSIPEEFWTVLVESFFQFRFNNAFHVQFYKLFRVALYSEQSTVYERYFVKPNLVGRLIEHYKATSQPTGSRGYIILILNCIRLSADVEVQNTANMAGHAVTAGVQEGTISRTFWTDLLRTNSEWKEFQKTLREATLEQTRDTLCDMDPNLRFQFAPLQSRQPSEAPLTKRHIGIPGVSARGNDGIDLGSQYGNSLGFGVPMKYDRAADEQLKKQSEQDHELQVQKALANLMPNVDWKLIPPQRVLNAMLGMNKSVNNSKQETDGSTSIGLSDGDSSKGSGGSEVESSNDAVTTTPKAKKKKKNKKKRQISSINTEDTAEEDGGVQGKSPNNSSLEAEEHDAELSSSGDGSDVEESRGPEINGGQSDGDLTSSLSETERLEPGLRQLSDDDRDDTGVTPQLSIDAYKLLQDIVWATIVSPPSETTVRIDHDEFNLMICKCPWKLPLKYDIVIGDKAIEPTPFKLQFTLQSPP